MDLTRYLGLAAICAAAYLAGEALARVHVPRLPVYLGVGALAGLVASTAVESAELAFPAVSTIALAVIGFIAGSHLIWALVRPRLKPIGLQIAGMSLAVPLVVGAAVFFLMPDVADGAELAAAVLAGTVMLALSPPEAIAIVSETRAEGPFTRLVLGATVVMDVVVVSCFSVALMLAKGLVGEDTPGSVWASVLLTLALAGIGGLVVGWLLQAALARVGSDGLLALGIFALAALTAVLAPAFTDWARRTYELDLEIDSLLIAMVAGILVVNRSRRPERLARVLERLAPWVYVVFFTLTGLGLHLDALIAAAGVAVVLWALRAGGLFAGSAAAMGLAHEPPAVRRVAWRAFMPQAGIALALAATIAGEFPEGGPALSAVIIAVVVVNEATGPFFLRSALKAVGEIPSDGPGPQAASAPRSVG